MMHTQIRRILGLSWSQIASATSRITLMLLLGLSLAACDDDDDGYQLTIESAENGSVSVSPQADSYAAGTQVTVTATANSGYLFSQWSGASSATDASITLVMNEDKSLQANFDAGVIIELAEATNGQFTVEPAITSGETVPFGTEFTITATPDSGYVLDSAYKMMAVVDGWDAYIDESFSSPYTVTTDADDVRFKIYGGDLDKYVLGAGFVTEDTWGELQETLNVVYATPGSKTLKYDVYAPPGASNLPIIIIVHGGGWSLNNEDIMRGQARYLAQSGHYVVASIDYRLTTDLDDPTPTKAEMMEDVYGAIAHIQENAAVYGGDSNRLIITGDSAGGQLSANTALLAPYIGEGDYSGEIGSSYLLPSYVPSGMTVDELKTQISDSIIAVAPSYGAFVSSDGVGEMDPAAEPMSNIPNASERVLPPYYVQVGSEDTTVGTANVKAFAAALEAAGQEVTYVEYEGASHAYFDWKPDADVQEVFNTVGKPALDDMLTYFDAIIAAQDSAE